MYSEKSTGPLYLASASPRRRALLEQIGVASQRILCEVDERPLAGELPADYVERVTRAKVQAGIALAPAQSVVLAADTAVVAAGRILGKPVDREQGLAMLRQLSGGWHTVMTAVAVGQADWVSLVRVDTQVCFRALSEEQIQAYWDTGEPQDKAGGYGIQGLAAVFVARLEGSYSAVVGLPLQETAELLAEFGIACWQGH